MTRSTKRDIGLIVAVALLAGLPVLLRGFPRGFDTACHLSIYRAVAHQVWTGDLYPRWLEEMNAGLGSPVFFLHGPVPYVTTSLLRPIQWMFSGWDDYRQLGTTFVLVLMVSGINFYLLARRLAASRIIALAGGMLFMVIPYRLCYDFYACAAIGTVWGAAWTPLLIYSADRLIKGDRYGTPLLCFSYAMIVMSHTYTHLLFLAVVVLYVVWFTPADRRIQTFLKFGGALALGAMVGAIYFLPAVHFKDEVSIDRVNLAIPTAFYGNNYLYVSDRLFHPPHDATKNRWYLSWLALASSGLAAFALGIVFRYGNKLDRKKALCWAVVAAASVFMFYPISGFVWRTVPILLSFQFPARFHAPLTFAVVALVVIACDVLQRTKGSLSRALAFSAVAVCLLAGIGAGIKYTDTLSELDAGGYADIRFDADLPGWMPGNPQLATIAGVKKIVSDNTQIVAPLNGNGTATVLGWEPREIRIRTQATEETQFKLRRFFFSRWRAVVEPGGAIAKIEPTPVDGLMAIRVPAGEHEVRLYLDTLGIERFSAALSFAGVLGLIGLFLLERRKSKLPEELAAFQAQSSS